MSKNYFTDFFFLAYNLIFIFSSFKINSDILLRISKVSWTRFEIIKFLIKLSRSFFFVTELYSELKLKLKVKNVYYQFFDLKLDRTKNIFKKNSRKIVHITLFMNYFQVFFVWFMIILLVLLNFLFNKIKLIDVCYSLVYDFCLLSNFILIFNLKSKKIKKI